MNETLSVKLDKWGRIYLPIRVRRALDLHPGDRVVWEIYDDHLVMRKAREEH